MSKDNKMKHLTQLGISSRMNFLFQASNLMAVGNQPKLAAYYGKLCRNVGNKAVMHMAPALKRSLCRRCFLPLIPGVNTELHVAEGAQDAKTAAHAPSNGAAKTKKKRHRRQRKKPKSQNTGNTNQEESQVQIQESTEQLSLFLECSLCCGRRSFAANSQRDCWLEQPQSMVQVVSFPKEKD
ncbi:uncharacterized protein LOC6724838 [Drosophila simulans]|uniref:GD16540 n=1 Tax=Drosophila simulans TaxID=7240 RepID=B4R2L8_DROSI|nr:uncharacterized protein LOC6724838 [Drosophila simulans]EDX16818.1 GD16540 [Drosophila simulans]KMZ07596.1 uncharacterized protein Dsimw501_GD16540 [Drosophila simulans]